MKAKVKIAVVGDVRDKWEAEDRIALERMGIDLFLWGILVMKRSPLALALPRLSLLIWESIDKFHRRLSTDIVRSESHEYEMKYVFKYNS